MVKMRPVATHLLCYGVILECNHKTAKQGCDIFVTCVTFDVQSCANVLRDPSFLYNLLPRNQTVL